MREPAASCAREAFDEGGGELVDWGIANPTPPHEWRVLADMRAARHDLLHLSFEWPTPMIPVLRRAGFPLVSLPARCLDVLISNEAHL